MLHTSWPEEFLSEYNVLCWHSIFFLLVQSNLTCTWFQVAANKNHTIILRARDTEKLNKRRQFFAPKKNKKGMCSRIYDTGWLRIIISKTSGIISKKQPPTPKNSKSLNDSRTWQISKQSFINFITGAG